MVVFATRRLNQPQVYMCPSPISNLFKFQLITGPVMQTATGMFKTPPLPPHNPASSTFRAVIYSQEASSPGALPSLDLNIVAPTLVKFRSDNCSHAICKVLITGRIPLTLVLEQQISMFWKRGSPWSWVQVSPSLGQ